MSLVSVEIGSKIIKKNLGKTFGKYVSNLISRWNMKHSNVTMFNFFTVEVNVYLYMFSASMINWVIGHINSTNIVPIGKSSCRNRTLEFKKQVTNPRSLKNHINSASALDLETVGCHLADQDTKLSPKKK